MLIIAHPTSFTIVLKMLFHHPRKEKHMTSLDVLAIMELKLMQINVTFSLTDTKKQTKSKYIKLYHNEYC